jgi:ProP effector
MTVALTNNPLHARPTLRLKSSAPPPEPATVPRPTPPPRPAPAVAEPLAAELGAVDTTKRNEKRLFWAEVSNTRRQLIRRFPAIFRGHKATPKLPLKVGIYADVCAAAADIDPKLIAAAIGQYVRAGNYGEFLVEGATRFDLNGQPCGVVAAHEVRRHPAVTTEETK